MISKSKIITAIALLFIFFLVFLFFANTWHAKPVPKEAINEIFRGNTHAGIKREAIHKIVSAKDVLIEIAIVDIKSSGLEVKISSPSIFNGADRSSYTGFSLSEYMSLGGYQIVQSGGFLSSWSPPLPLGYVKISGTEYNREHTSWLTRGVFCTNGKNFEIFNYRSHDQFSGWSSCIQAGPIIALNGKNVLDTRRNTGFITKETHRQSFLCKTQEGRLLMGIADKIKLVDLAPIILQSKADGGLGCVDSVALNGKDIAGMLIKEKDILVPIGNISAPLPNAIVIK